MPNATGPIADLSYRTYDGVLDPPTQRWKVIAKANIMRVAKLKAYWVLTLLGGWYYGVMTIVLFVLDSMMQGTGNDSGEALKRLGALDWTGQFLHGFSFGQLFYLFVTMMAGASAIANDNRANALLVYLSKPCTKKDYIIGKWVGVFVPVFAAMLLPALIFYAFGALNYRDFGFVSDDPWLMLRVIGMIIFGASLHASLSLGVSSMFNQGRLAGATYVGIYFISSMVTVFLKVIITSSGDAPERLSSLAKGLYYCSIDGINIGIAKIFLNTDGSEIFIGARDFIIDRPSPLLAFGVFFAVSAIALRLLWKRVRAVEVVG